MVDNRHIENPVLFGDNIKALDDQGKIGGYIIRYTTKADPDLQGDFFEPDSNIGLKDGDSVPILYHHGLDPVMKSKVLDRATVKLDDIGAWVEAQLDLRDKYERAIFNLAKNDKLGWSTAPVGIPQWEQVSKTAYKVLQWVVGEGSLTPTPAEPRNAAMPLKSLFNQLTELEIEQETQPGSKMDSDTVVIHTPQITIISEGINETKKSAENPTMEENTQPQADPGQATPDYEQMIADLRNENAETRKSVDALSEGFNRIAELLENEQPDTMNQIVELDGGRKNPDKKSLADFTLAVYRNDRERLSKVYKAATELTGPGGGYPVPVEHLAPVTDVGDFGNLVAGRATRFAVNSNKGTKTGIDQTIAPTANTGASAFAGGLTMVWTEDGSTISTDDIVWNQIEYNIHKLAGVTVADNEAIADASQVEMEVTNLYQRARSAMIEWAFLRGNGVGKPLGILNAPALLTAGTNDADFTLSDAYAMYEALHTVGGQPFWILSKTVTSNLGAMESSGGGITWNDNAAGPIPGTILGMPFVFSEHLPAIGTQGAVLLVDMAAYYHFDRQMLTVAFSEHANFLSDRATWRFTERLDGQPAIDNAITLADGSTQVSPFVVLVD